MISLSQLAEHVQGKLIGDTELLIGGIAPIETAGKDQITFLTNNRYSHLLKDSEAAAIIVGAEIKGLLMAQVVCANPYFGVAQVIEYFHPPKKQSGISREARAKLYPKAHIHEAAVIYPGVHICESVQIGSGTVIYPGVFIGEGAICGQDCLIYPNCVIMDHTQIGNRVIIQPGAVIGGDGYGFVWDGQKHMKIPQVGIVVIEDEVEIGANSCIDRATLGKTVVARGTKIDNLVQIAHNVVLGENCLIVSQVGISGSTRIGKNVAIGGQAGLIGHIAIGDNTKIAAKSGVGKDIPANVIYSGIPARPHHLWLKSYAYINQLEAMKTDIKKLKQTVFKDKTPGPAAPPSE